MIHITAKGRGCDSPTDVACLMPTKDQCWTESTDGRDLGVLAAETNEKYYVYDNLEYNECVEKANAVDQEDAGWNYYFSYTEEVNNGLCKVLKPGVTHPDISASTQVNSHLYINTCRPSIALVNKHSSAVYGAFDWGSGWSSDSINGWIQPGNQRLYTGLDPFMLWAQIKEGSVIPQVGFFDAMAGQYVLCEENFSFTGGLKTYYLSANGCTTEDF